MHALYLYTCILLFYVLTQLFVQKRFMNFVCY